MDNSSTFRIGMQPELVGEEKVINDAEQLARGIFEKLANMTTPAFANALRQAAVNITTTIEVTPIINPAKVREVTQKSIEIEAKALKGTKDSIGQIRSQWGAAGNDLFDTLGLREAESALNRIGESAETAADDLDLVGRALARARKEGRAMRESGLDPQGRTYLAGTLTPRIIKDSKLVETLAADSMGRHIDDGKGGYGIGFVTLPGQHGADLGLLEYGKGIRRIVSAEVKTRSLGEKNSAFNLGATKADIFETVNGKKSLKESRDAVGIGLAEDKASLSAIVGSGKNNALGVAITDDQGIGFTGSFIANTAIMRRIVKSKVDKMKLESVDSKFFHSTSEKSVVGRERQRLLNEAEAFKKEAQAHEKDSEEYRKAMDESQKRIDQADLLVYTKSEKRLKLKDIETELANMDDKETPEYKVKKAEADKLRKQVEAEQKNSASGEQRRERAFDTIRSAYSEALTNDDQLMDDTIYAPVTQAILKRFEDKKKKIESLEAELEGLDKNDKKYIELKKKIDAEKKQLQQEEQDLLTLARAQHAEMRTASAGTADQKAYERLELKDDMKFEEITDDVVKVLSHGMTFGTSDISLNKLAREMINELDNGPAELIQERYSSFMNSIVKDISSSNQVLSQGLAQIFNSVEITDSTQLRSILEQYAESLNALGDDPAVKAIQRKIIAMTALMRQAQADATTQATGVKTEAVLTDAQKEALRGLSPQELGEIGNMLTSGVFGLGGQASQAPQQAAQSARRAAGVSEEISERIQDNAEEIVHASSTLQAAPEIPAIEIKDDINRATVALGRIGESFSAVENDIKTNADEVEEAAKRAGQLGVGLTKDTPAARANAAVDPNARAAMKRARIDVGDAPLGITQSDQQQRKGLNLNGFGMFAMAGGGGEGSPLGGALSQVSELPGMIMKGLSILLAGSNVFIVAIVAIAAILFAISKKYGGLGKALKLLAGRIRGQTSTGDDPDPDSVSDSVERAKPPRLGWLRSFAQRPASANTGFTQMYTGSADEVKARGVKLQRDLLKAYHPDRARPDQRGMYDEIGRHIGELTNNLRVNDLEDLNNVRHDPEKFLETINRQREAMGKPIIQAAKEAAAAIETAGTVVSSEIRETATDIDKASAGINEPAQKAAAVTAKTIRPDQYLRMPTQQDLTGKEQQSLEATARSLRGQFTGNEGVGAAGKRGTAHFKQYQKDAAEMRAHLEGLVGSGNQKFLQELNQANASYKLQLMRKQKEQLAALANKAIQTAAQVVPAQADLPAAVAATGSAIVPYQEAGDSIVGDAQKALIPIRQAGPQIVEAAEKALVPLNQAGLALLKKVQKLNLNKDLPQLPAGTETAKDTPPVTATTEPGKKTVNRRVRPGIAAKEPEGGWTPDAETIGGEPDKTDGSARKPKSKMAVECPDPCPDPCPCKKGKSGGDGKGRDDDDKDSDDGGGDGRPPTAGGTMPGGGEPPVGPVNRYIAALERVVNYLQEWQQRLGRLGNFLQQFANQIGQLRNTVNQAFQQAKQYVSQFAQFAQQGLSRLGTVVDNVGKKFAGFGARVRNGFESAKESAATLYFLSSTMTQAGSKLSGFGKAQLQKANQFFNEYSGYEMATNRLSVSAGVGVGEDGTINPEQGFQVAQDFVFGLQSGEFKGAGGERIYTDMYNAEQVAQATYYYQSAAGTPEGGQSMLASKGGQAAMARIMGPILNMAAATQTPVEEYIKGVVNIAQQFGYDPSQSKNADVMGNIANVVGQIANVTTLEIPDILETFKYVGPQLNMLSGGDPGAGLGDALMLVEMASRAGIKGSMAGTGIGQIVSTFVDVPEAVAESVAPLLGLGNLKDGEAVSAFEGMFQTKDGKIDGGILGAISKIVESTSGEPQDVAKVLSKIFTQNATRTSSAIAAQIVKAAESQEFLDAAAAYDAGDFTKATRLYEEAMAKTSDTVTASVNRVKNAFFQLKATMFDAVKTPLKGYLNDLANIFFELADALESNPFISKLIAGLTGVISIVATVLGALLTMGGTLFMIQRSFIMAGGSISLFFGILSTVAAGFFTMIPVILLAGAAIAILAGHLQKTGTTFDEFFANLRGDFGEGLGQKLQDFSLKAVKALELVTFAFYEFVNTILMGNDVGSNFLGAFLGKVFGPEAAGIILGMFNKISSGLTGFREDVNKEVDDVQGKFESLKNIPSLFKGLGQAFATGRVDVSDAFGINQLGEAFGFGSSGLQAIVVEAANQIWVAISEIWAIFQYFKGQFIATFDQMRDATGTAIDTAPFMQFLVLIRTITVGIVAGFLAALLAATQAVAGLVSRLNGLSGGNSKIQELTYNVTGLTLTLEKLGTILGFVFGAAMAGRMIMMIQPIGQLAVHFAKIGIVAGQVGVAIGKTVAMFALQAAQFVVNIGLLALQAAAYAAYIGIQIISTGIGLAVAAVSTIVALAKTQEAGATLSSAFAALSAASAFTILKIVLMAVVAVVLILVGIYFILIASLIIAALGIIAIIAATEGLRAAFDAVVGFVMSFIDAMRDVINLLKGVYNWAMGFLMAASGASTLAGTLKEIGKALAWMIGLPLAGLFVIIVAVAGAAVGLVRGMLAIGRAVKNSDIFKAMTNGLKTLFSGIGRLASALWPIIKILGLLGIVVLAVKFGPILLAFKMLGVLIGHAIGLIGNIIKNIAKMIEWFTMAFRAFANGDWVQGLKLLGNVVGQFFFGIVEIVVDAVFGMVDAVLSGIGSILGALAALPKWRGVDLGSPFRNAKAEVDNFRTNLDETKASLLGWAEEKLTFTVDAEYDINLSDEERRRAMGILTEIEQLELKVRVEVFVDNPTLMGPHGVPLQESYMTDGGAAIADLAYNEFEEGPRQGLYTVLVEYRDAETGELITNVEQGQPLEVFDKDGNATTIYRRVDDASTKDINEEGYVANIDGTYMYVNLRRREEGGLSFDVDEDAGELGDGRVFISNTDRIIRSVEERRAARDAAFEENAAAGQGQMFGGIFSDATDWISKYIGENDSLQSLFGFADIDVENLRDGDLGRALTPQEIKAMMDATDQSPRAKELLAPYLDEAYAQSEIYDDLYWERERLTAEYEAGMLSEEEYLDRVIEITRQMSEAAVTAEDIATENERLLKAEEDRLKLANEFTEAFGKALTEGFATWENYILGSIARVNSAISTANELIIGNRDKIDEALAASGDQFFYRDPYTGADASRPYTTQEMLMSVGGFSKWNPLEDGPLDYWLMNDPDNQAWRDSLIYQGKNPADIAKVAAGDNRWGANTGLRDMVIGEMMTGLNPSALDSLNRSYLDYRDIASYASMMMASGQDFNLGTYLMDSGQMFMQDGVWTDINSENLDEALAWMNEEYGITLTVDTITDETFEDLRGLIFDDKGQIVAATGEFMANLPKIVEGAFGKIAVMDEEEFAKLDNATKAYLNAAGVTIVTATTEEMNRYSLDVTKQIPQIINEGIDLKFDDLNQDGLVDAYFIDPATGTATDVSHSALLRNDLYDAAGQDYILSDAERAGLIRELTGEGGLFENYEGDLNPIIDTLLPWLDAQKIAAEEARLANEAQVDATSDGVAAGIEDAKDVLYQATKSATFDALTDYYGPSKNMTSDARDLLHNILRFPNGNGGRSGPSVGAVNPENAPTATTWGEIEEIRRIRRFLGNRGIEDGESVGAVNPPRVARADGSPAVLPYDYDKFFGGGQNPGNFDTTSQTQLTDDEVTSAVRKSISEYIAGDLSKISIQGISNLLGQGEGNDLWNSMFNLDYNRGLDAEGNPVSWASEPTSQSLQTIVDLFDPLGLDKDNTSLGDTYESLLQANLGTGLNGFSSQQLGVNGPIPVVLENAMGGDGVLNISDIIEGTDVAKIMKDNPNLTVEQAQAQAQAFVQALVDVGIVEDGSALEEALNTDIEAQTGEIYKTLANSVTEWTAIVDNLNLSTEDFAQIAADNGVSAGSLITGSGDLLVSASHLAIASGQISIAAANAAAINASGGAIDGRQQGPYASGGRVTTPFQLVGELGRELVSLPMGSRVFSASQTENILAEAFKPSVNMMAATVEMPNSIQMETDSRSSQSSGGDTIVVNFNGDMNIRDQRDIELLVDEIDRELGRRSQNAKRGMMGTSRSVSVD